MKRMRSKHRYTDMRRDRYQQTDRFEKTDIDTPKDRYPAC